MAGKIATGAISLAVVSAGVAWWQTEPGTKQQILTYTGHLIGWVMLVLIVPWAAFALIGWINRMQTNAAGATLVLVLTAVESTALAWLFGWSLHGATEWILFAAATLVAGVYNLFTCDWIAEKTE